MADFGNSLIRKITPTGVVSTFAGNFNSGSDDGKGTAAKFSLPYGIAFDANGNLFVADTYNNKIRKITPDGTVTTVAGTGAQGRKDGQALSATFNTPYNIAVDKTGNIFVADHGNGCVRAIYGGALVTTFSDTTYNLPVGIAIDNRGMIYLSCEKSFNIVQLGANGKPTTATPFSGGYVKDSVNGIDTLTKYRGNMGLTIDASGSTLLVADAFGDIIRKVSTSGYYTHPLLPDGLKIDSAGTIRGTPTKVTPAANYFIYNTSLFGTYADTVNITVGVGKQVITFVQNTPKMYGDTDFTLKATSTNPLIPITYTSGDTKIATIVNGNKLHIVGAGNVTITANQAGNSNFTAATPVGQVFQINKAVLTIRPDDKFKTKGDKNPPLTATYTGFVLGEDTTALSTRPKLTTAVDTGTAAGSYPITASGAVAANYTFNYLSGALVVFPVPKIIYNGTSTIAKGDSLLLTVDPASGYTYQWALNGSNISKATKSTVEAKQSGYYTVTITANGYSTTSLPVPIVAELQLPQDNFKLTVKGLSCKGSANGSITVNAQKSMSYSATLTASGVNSPAPYKFADSLTVSNLVAGSYSLCISVDGEIFNQCYQVNVTEPKDLAVYATVNNVQNNVTLQMDGGTNYTINLNDKIYTTTQNVITLPLSAGNNKLVVTTDKLCQGVIERVINLSKDIKPFPNPFQGILNVNLGSNTVKNVQVNVVNSVDGKSVYSNRYTDKTGVLEFDLSGLPSGVYYLNLSLDDKTQGYKIIKR